MKRCKLFILCCLMIISAVGNGNAEEPKPKPEEWQIKGALAALDDAIPGVRAKALEKLIEFDAAKHISKDRISMIAELVKSNDINVQIAAISALGNMKESAKEHIPLIVEALKSKDWNVQRAAIKALGNMKNLAKEHILLIVEKLNSDDQQVQIAAISALGNMKELAKEYIPLIVEKLKSNDKYVQIDSIEALGNMKDLAKEYIPLIVEKSSSNDRDVQRAAINALEKLGKEYIINLPLSDENVSERELLNTKDFLEIFISGVPEARVIQKLYLNNELTKEHIPLMFEKLKSDNLIVQMAAIKALGNMKELAKDYIPQIVEKLKDSKVQSTLIQALTNITELNAKMILTIVSPIYKNTDRNIELRFLAHLTGGGKEDVEILLKWLGEPEKNKPQKLDHELAIKTLKIFSEVWETSKAYKKLNEDLAQQIATVISMKDIRWTPEDLDILKAHETHLKDFPQAQSVSNVISSIEAQMALIKWTKRFSKVFGIHLGFWIILIFLYPRYPMVQATFFWNKWMRTWIAGFGYINIALLWIPFLRKKLFEPFADTLLADANIGEFEHEAYFPDSDVEHARKRQAIIRAIPNIRGQILLQGESGLGKSLYLRKLVRDSESVAVYLKAERCAKGVLEAIQAKLEGIAKDTEFLKHLIYAGALDICIDGLNEVSPDTRAKVWEFAESNFKGNIIMATQPIEWEPPSIAKTYILKPLRDDQIEEFLISREQTFSQDAKIRGQAYQQACKDYLATALCQTQCGEETETARRMLSNPMDLSIVGQMIGHGQNPNVFRLYEQQFRMMSAKYEREHLRAFPIAAFSERVYQQRLSDNTEVPYQDFAEESECLEDFKMALRRQSQNKETWHFRHDKIMEYFIALTFENNENRLIDNISDPRFRGVYFMLATLMPDDAAMSLREELIQYAARTKDHTVSDTFVQLMRSRKQGNP